MTQCRAYQTGTGKLLQFEFIDHGSPQGTHWLSQVTGDVTGSWRVPVSAGPSRRERADMRALGILGVEVSTFEVFHNGMWERLDISGMPLGSGFFPGVTITNSGVGYSSPAVTRAHNVMMTLPAPPAALPAWALPDSAKPDTLGWRAWLAPPPDDPSETWLISPHQHTAWYSAELSVERWDDGDVVRGVAGIHARLLPKTDWRAIGWPDGDGSELGDEYRAILVTGIVERYGRFVLGTLGWRAERVVIRELMAPSTEIGLKLEEKYPDVIVHYKDQLEGALSCRSEKSSELGKGNRPLNPSPIPPLLTSQLVTIQAIGKPTVSLPTTLPGQFASANLPSSRRTLARKIAFMRTIAAICLGSATALGIFVLVSLVMQWL